MDTKTITYNVSFALRRGLQADLLAVNEIPNQGEPIVEIDTLKIKIGDGETPYSELDYIGAAELAVLQTQLDAFFASAEIGDAAIDTLVEIQKILNDSSIDIQNLLNKVNEFEALHQEINADIEKVENDFKTADSAIVAAHNKDKEEIDAQIDELTKSCNDAFDLAAADRKAIHEEISGLTNTHNLDNANVNERIDKVEEKYREADAKIVNDVNSAIDTINTEVNKKANLTDVNTIDERVLTLENAGYGTVTQIENAKAEAIVEATSKADTANANAKTYADSLKENTNQEIADIRESIDAVNSRVDNLGGVDLEAFTADLATLREETSQAFIDVRTDFAAADAEIVQTNTNDHQTIRNEMSDLSTAAADDRALIREQYANADSILQSTCEGENAKIRAEFAAADLQLTTDLGNEIARAEAAEAKALADAKAYTDEVKTNLLGDGVLNDTYDTLTKISAWIADEGVDATELTDAIATEANTRSAEDSRIEEAFKAADKEINAHLTETDKKHQEDIQSLGNTITNLGAELRGVDNTINARIDGVITDYKAADIALGDSLKAYLDEQLGVIMNGSY